MKVAEDSIRELLRQRHRLQPGADDDFSVRNLTEMLQAQEESSRVMTLLLAAVAGVSLVVGGIGIMNIMLVSVTERTREIGLRMAVGARGRDILRAVPDRGGDAEPARRRDRHRARRAARPGPSRAFAGWPVAIDAAVDRCWRPASRPRSACSSASIRRGARRRCCRSRRCATNRRRASQALSRQLAGCASRWVRAPVTCEGDAARCWRDVPADRRVMQMLDVRLRRRACDCCRRRNRIGIDARLVGC